MDGIIVDEQLLSELTSEYAKKYGCIPETHKQAVQFAYEYGRQQSATDAVEYAIQHVMDILDEQKDVYTSSYNPTDHAIGIVIDCIKKKILNN